MNNKGQILPIFVILLPVLIILISYIVDVGIMYTEKRRITNTVKDAISYYIDNKDNANSYDLTLEYINKNIKNSDVKIEISDEYIVISVNKKHNSIYNIINLNNTISVKYKGYYADKRIVKG